MNLSVTGVLVQAASGPPFQKPHIEYAQLWPMLVVFGVACLGVIVEAFVPRERAEEYVVLHGRPR